MTEPSTQRRHLGGRPDRDRLADGGARHARRRHGADHDPRSISAPRSTQLEWTVNAYNLSFAVLLMTAAALGDRFGRRRLYAAGLAALRASRRAACALAPSVGWLIAARAVQGVGAALVMPLGLALLSAAFPPERRGTAIGLFSAVTGHRGRQRAAGRRRGRRRAIDWHVDLLDQRPDRARRDPARARAHRRELRPRQRDSTCRASALVTAGALGVVWGLVRGNSAGWGSLEVVGAAGRRRWSLLVGLRRLGAARTPSRWCR